MNTKIAVLLTCFNRRETTLSCLRRIADQTDVQDLEIQVFLADDRSSDGTTFAVASEFPAVTILRGTGSLYWGGGMRLADTTAWATRPDFILWLNDDVVLEQNAIRQLVSAAEATERRSVTVGAVQDPATGLASYGGHVIADRKRPLRTSLVFPNGVVQAVDTMNGNVVLVPAAVRAAIGTVDIAFSHNMGDMDYAFRAKAAGFDVQLVGSFVGSCATNISKARWKDPSVPLRQRLRQLVSPKGLPPKEWLTFTRRHCGWRWPRYFVSPFLKAIAPALGPRSAHRNRPRDAAGSRMTVVHVLGELRRSGAEMMLVSAASQFDNLGVNGRVISISASSDTNVVQEFEQSGYPVIHIPLSGLGGVYGFIKAYRSELRSIGIGCVHVHPERASILTCLVPRIMGIGVIRTVHSNFSFEGFLKLRKRCERLILRLAGVRTAAISTSVQANEIARFLNPCDVVLNWYDEARFVPPTQPARDSARAALSLASGRPAVAVVGNCSSVKNHELIFQALAALPQESRPVLLHVGEGESTTDEKQLCARLEVGDDVIFLGSLRNVLPILDASDAFAMPSLYEGLGIAAIEALATGLPILVSDTPGLLDLAQLFDAATPVDLSVPNWASALASISCIEGDAANRAGQHATVSRLFGISRGANEYAGIYRFLVMKRRTSRRSDLPDSSLEIAKL